MLSFIWWIVGFYWVTAGGQSLTRDSPQLYWLVGIWNNIYLLNCSLYVVFCLAIFCNHYSCLCYAGSVSHFFLSTSWLYSSVLLLHVLLESLFAVVCRAYLPFCMWWQIRWISFSLILVFWSRGYFEITQVLYLFIS